MKRNHSVRRRFPQVSAICAGAVLFSISLVLVYLHIVVLMEVQTASVPLVAELADLEERETALTEQVELSQIHAQSQAGSLGEKLDAYVLPKETDFDRLVAVFDIFTRSLEKQGMASDVTGMSFGDPVGVIGGQAQARPLRFSLSANEEGMERLFKFVQMSGLMTVGDALDEDEIKSLFLASEKENPASIVSLEQFLSSDLLRFARDPKAYEDQIKRSFSGRSFLDAFEKISDESLLSSARNVLGGGFGASLLDAKLWPVQFVTLNGMKISAGGAEEWYRVNVELFVWEG